MILLISLAKPAGLTGVLVRWYMDSDSNRFPCEIQLTRGKNHKHEDRAKMENMGLKNYLADAFCMMYGTRSVLVIEKKMVGCRIDESLLTFDRPYVSPEIL